MKLVSLEWLIRKVEPPVHNVRPFHVGLGMQIPKHFKPILDHSLLIAARCKAVEVFRRVELAGGEAWRHRKMGMASLKENSVC